MKSKSKIFVCAMLIMALAIPQMMWVSANTEVSVTIDGVPVSFPDQAPAIIDGRTLVPVRGVFEALGFTVLWDGDTMVATIFRDNDFIWMSLAPDSNHRFMTNDTIHDLDVPAQIIGGRTMVPIRAPLESVGYSVSWDAATNTVVINTGVVEQIMGVATSLPSAEIMAFPNLVSAGYSDAQIIEMIEQEVFRLTNIERENYGLPPLIWSDELGRAARSHSEDMVTNGFLSHTSSDGSGRGDRVEREGWTGCRGVGENAARSCSPQTFINGTMNSPMHRANILSVNVTHIGVGYAFIPDVNEPGFFLARTTQKFGSFD
jgi:uncharacterized protein YkwD